MVTIRIVPTEKGKTMTLEKAINLLVAEYERALRLEYVRNPIAFALHRVWKMADKERKDNA